MLSHLCSFADAPLSPHSNCNVAGSPMRARGLAMDGFLPLHSLHFLAEVGLGVPFSLTHDVPSSLPPVTALWHHSRLPRAPEMTGQQPLTSCHSVSAGPMPSPSPWPSASSPVVVPETAPSWRSQPSERPPPSCVCPSLAPT